VCLVSDDTRELCEEQHILLDFPRRRQTSRDCLISASIWYSKTYHSVTHIKHKFVQVFFGEISPWPESASEQYRPSNCLLSAKLMPTFEDRRYRVVSVTDPLRPYYRFSRPEQLLFISSSSSIVLTRLSGPRSRPTNSHEIWEQLESNRDLWICSQELWPLDQEAIEIWTLISKFYWLPIGIGVGVLLAADRQSTSSSGYRASLWDPWPDFILFFFFRLTITWLFFLRRPLWRENGSVVYSGITHWSQ
jgi:hypothetical protein